MKMEAIDLYAIWDLDNCLADDRARIKLINWGAADPTERYRDYHAACAEDPARNTDTFHTVTQFARPVFFTGRPEAVRGETAGWVRGELSVRQPPLLMRRPGDSRPSVLVKQEMVLLYMRYLAGEAPRAQGLCWGAFDDRPEIVEMYRRCGLNAALLSIHSVCAYTAPKAAK